MTIFRSGSHDDQLSSLNDCIAYGSQESNSCEDPRAYSHKKNYALLGLCTSDGL